MYRMISSTSNPQFKKWRSLLRRAGIDKHGLFLLSGQKIVRELLTQQPSRCLEIILSPDHTPFSPSTNMTIWTVSRELFRELDMFGTKSALLVGPIPDIHEVGLFEPSAQPELVTALGDPANLGALLRSAEGFGIQHITLLQESAHPFHPKALRASSGSSFRLSFSWGPSIHHLQNCRDLIVLDLHGEPIHTFRWPKHFRLLVGQEGRGIPNDLSAQRVTIPMRGHVESLNGAISGSLGLAAWTWFKNTE